MLKFNQFGNLDPAAIIETDLLTVEQTFAFNTNRAVIFQQFKAALERILELAEDQIPCIWIDGSFATLKTNPGDVDVVVFVNFQAFEQNYIQFKNLKKANKDTVDLHFVEVFPENHPSLAWYESDRIEFLHLFLTDRNKRSKGILQINF